MSEGPSPIPGLVAFTLLTVLTVAAVLAWTEPLGPDGTPLYAVPPVALGLYLAVHATWIREFGVYGALLGTLPGVVHVGMQAVGCALVGVGGWLLLSLPPAGAGKVAGSIPILDQYCQGEPEVRLERTVIPTVNDLLELRPTQAPSLKEALDARLVALMTRCGNQARTAFEHPRGTHASWRRLRDWLSEHPDLHALPEDDPLWSMEWRSYEPERVLPAGGVPVVLEP